VAQDRLFQLPQGRGRLDAELGDERPPCRPVHLQRVRLSAGRVERLHQRAAQALVERVGTHEPLELGNELSVAAEREVGLDSQLECGQMRSPEALNLRLRGRIVGEVRQWLAAPEVERLGQKAARSGCLRPFCLGDQPLEAKQVDLIRVDADQVSRLLRHDHPAVAEQLAQLRDVELKRVRRVGRWAGWPQRVDQAVDRDGTVRRQEECREQCALLWSAERDRATLVIDLERSQDPELHLRLATMTGPAPSGKAQSGLSLRVQIPGVGVRLPRRSKMDVHTPVDIGMDFLGYRIEELIGRGGMGVVYRAYDLRLRRPVAIKLVAPSLARDEHFRERFAHETELVMSLEHPNVVPIYDAGDVDGHVYLAMRLVEGTDLGSLLRVEGALEPARMMTICAQIASALDAAHARGLVHRDVKPSNVLLDSSEHVYLADFGLTRRLEDPVGDPGVDLLIGITSLSTLVR
jgi:hypothetical protein